MMRFFVLASFLVLSLNYSEACKCQPIHPQVAYCRADFVILAIPTNKVTNPTTQRSTYTVTITKKIKTTPIGDVALVSKKIRTASTTAACGVQMQLNKKYLLIGNVNNNRANIDSCGFNRLWSLVPLVQKVGILDEYEDGCDPCTIENCSVNCDQVIPQDDQCILDRSTQKYSCFIEWSKCVPDSTGVCQWSESDDLTTCIANTP